ncbi:hypothetical protein TrRE_jg9332 [Triparma retinervis]|uniref:Uncharacterized protein n=1 Tax=Triparma retinervis TaxID=2557542 RepID=A0A9W7A2J6_9STRA|nr:hypothetical protein TrRE_jg9332 [Triparma retinervis]
MVATMVATRVPTMEEMEGKSVPSVASFIPRRRRNGTPKPQSEADAQNKMASLRSYMVSLGVELSHIEGYKVNFTKSTFTYMSPEGNHYRSRMDVARSLGAIDYESESEDEMDGVPPPLDHLGVPLRPASKPGPKPGRQPYISRKTKTRQLGVGPDGVKKHARPRGKAPKGKVWNYGSGLWVELSSLPFGGSEFIYKQWPPKEVIMAGEKWKRRPGKVNKGIRVGEYYLGEEVSCRWLDKVFKAQVNKWIEKDASYDLWFPEEKVLGKVKQYGVWVLGGREMTEEEVKVKEEKAMAEVEAKKQGRKREREEGDEEGDEEGGGEEPQAKKAFTGGNTNPPEPAKREMQQVMTTVPEGLVEGDMFNFTFEGGTFKVTVPPNLAGDRTMKVRVPKETQ